MTVSRRAQARRDIVENADHLDQINQALSERFLEAVERTISTLESRPGLGAPYPLLNPSLQNLRHHPVKRFPKYIVFYLPTASGIEVVRVLYGARDLDTILEAEP